MTKFQRGSRLAAPLLLGALMALGGCAQQKPLLYQWEGYENNVDTYFRGDRESLQNQSRLAEEDLQKIRASGKRPPPGYHAHARLLQGKQGNSEQLKQQLDAEKALFPESTSFVDYLLRNFKK